MDPIRLDQMDAIRLMNRIDRKFVTTSSCLEKILSMCEDSYYVLDMEGHRVFGYDSLYFDTPRLEMYLAHHSGKLRRFKIRCRTYLMGGLTFLEIKKKNNHKRTKKKRIEIPRESILEISEMDTAREFIADNLPYDASTLVPQLSTRFDRITLVNKGMTERLTIDRNISFHNYTSGRDASLGDAVIIELKQDGRVYSPMTDILLSLRVKPVRISKYCIGTALTRPDVKSGAFQNKIRYIEKLINKKLDDHDTAESSRI